jgi:hypothetical protein
MKKKRPRQQRSKKTSARRSTATTLQTHVILPDVHARKLDHDISRADLFRKLVEDEKPTKVIVIGDVGEFDSVSSFDQDKPAVLADKELKGDIDITLVFLDRALGPKNNQGAFRQFLVGNHEQRLDRVPGQHPELADMLNIGKTLQIARYFHSYVGYDGAIPGRSLLDAILYAHYHVAETFAKPISGMHSAHSMLQKSQGVSMCQGHSHLIDFKMATQRGTAKKKFGLVAGCFIEPTAKFGYCGNANEDSWSGITIIRGVEDGSFSEIRFVSLDELGKIYN